MNKNEIGTFNDMKNVVKNTAETVDEIRICLLGDPKKPDSLGLRGDVRNNVRWRTKVNKTLSALGIGVLLLFIKEGWQQFIKR